MKDEVRVPPAQQVIATGEFARERVTLGELARGLRLKLQQDSTPSMGICILAEMLCRSIPSYAKQSEAKRFSELLEQALERVECFQGKKFTRLELESTLAHDVRALMEQRPSLHHVRHTTVPRPTPRIDVLNKLAQGTEVSTERLQHIGVLIEKVAEPLMRAALSYKPASAGVGDHQVSSAYENQLYPLAHMLGEVAPHPLESGRSIPTR